MGENSAIAWTDHTYNAWEGCTKVGPGCDGCYAEARDQRWHAGEHWGPGAPRRLMSLATRNRPLIWEMRAAANPAFPNKVFCSSLCDIFDNEVPDEWREIVFDMWRRTPHLRWLPVTKRIGNAAKMLPKDWPDAFPHVGMIATVVTQAEVDRDLHKLLDLPIHPASWRGLSIEPQLEHMMIKPWLGKGRIEWVIAGGESKQKGHHPRIYHAVWTRSLIRQCADTGTAFFHKQLGAQHRGFDGAPWRDGSNGDMALWPEEFRIRQFPEPLR